MAKANPIKYPWQAGPNGEERSTQPTRFAEHVSGDVAWGASFAADLGLISNEQTKKIVDGVASYYLHRATLGNDQKVGIEDTVSVDEWHTGNDDLYTNAIADWVIRKSLSEQVWPADAMRFPNDYGGLLAYEGDTRKAYQQAAAQLVLWPLEKEGLVGDPIQFLDRFAGKNAPTGPAMSLSVDALIRARYGNADQALGEWRESWKQYTDGNPFLLFSEKPNQPDRTYFGTGAAGCLNTVIYGFAGARIVEDARQDKAKIKIANDKWLVFRPNLPSDWKKLTLRGITVMDKKYDVTCIGPTATIKVAGT
jgi:trehalose/maltose hydrolase-like predicted phosphorylase